MEDQALEKNLCQKVDELLVLIDQDQEDRSQYDTAMIQYNDNYNLSLEIQHQQLLQHQLQPQLQYFNSYFAPSDNSTVLNNIPPIILANPELFSKPLPETRYNADIFHKVQNYEYESMNDPMMKSNYINQKKSVDDHATMLMHKHNEDFAKNISSCSRVHVKNSREKEYLDYRKSKNNLYKGKPEKKVIKFSMNMNIEDEEEGAVGGEPRKCLSEREIIERLNTLGIGPDSKDFKNITKQILEKCDKIYAALSYMANERKLINELIKPEIRIPNIVYKLNSSNVEEHAKFLFNCIKEEYSLKLKFVMDAKHEFDESMLKKANVFMEEYKEQIKLFSKFNCITNSTYKDLLELLEWVCKYTRYAGINYICMRKYLAEKKKLSTNRDIRRNIGV